jgi:hypothetical protein
MQWIKLKEKGQGDRKLVGAFRGFSSSILLPRLLDYLYLCTTLV